MKGERATTFTCHVSPANGALMTGDDTVFADLGLSSKEYPKVLTTW